jgi:hypothetical protein
MSCRFCRSSVPVESSTCRHCHALIDSAAWHLLADIWLTRRPEDWTPEVAAFLQLSEGLDANPPRMRALGIVAALPDGVPTAASFSFDL